MARGRGERRPGLPEGCSVPGLELSLSPLQSRRREPVGPAPVTRARLLVTCRALRTRLRVHPLPRAPVPQPRAPIWKLSWLSTAHQLCTRRSPLRAGAHTGWEGRRRLGGARAPGGSLWPRTREGHAPQPRANSPPTCSRPTSPSARVHRNLFTQVREGRTTANGSHQRRGPRRAAHPESQGEPEGGRPRPRASEGSSGR